NAEYEHIIDKAVSDALKKYSEEATAALSPIMELEAKAFCLNDRDVIGVIKFKYIHPPLSKEYRFKRQQLYYQARKMFYKGEWDSFWLEMKSRMMIRRVNVGLERGIKVGEVLFH